MTQIRYYTDMTGARLVRFATPGRYGWIVTTGRAANINRVGREHDAALRNN